MSTPYTMQKLRELAGDGIDLLELDDPDLLATIAERDDLRAQLEAVTRERDALAQTSSSVARESVMAAVRIAALEGALRPLVDALNEHHTAECDDGNSSNCVACGGTGVADVANRLVDAARAVLYPSGLKKGGRK